MQEYTEQQAAIVVAPDVTCKIYRYGIASISILIIMWIGISFLPTPLRDELMWTKMPSWWHSINYTFPFSILVPALLWTILVAPFINIMGFRRWKRFEQTRQETIKNRLRGIATVTFPLPDVLTPLPASLTIHIRRNWKATAIAIPLYALLLGLLLWVDVVGWQLNMQYLAQQSEMSGWTFLGNIFYSLPPCLLCLPAIMGLIFAPRQLLVATQDGLFCQRGLRFSSLPWHEAVLFAVVAKERDTLVYELASRNSIIRWSSKITWSYDNFAAITIGAGPLNLIRAATSDEEYQWQIRQLTAMVAARTNLPLYDLRQKGIIV